MNACRLARPPCAVWSAARPGSIRRGQRDIDDGLGPESAPRLFCRRSSDRYVSLPVERQTLRQSGGRASRAPLRRNGSLGSPGRLLTAQAAQPYVVTASPSADTRPVHESPSQAGHATVLLVCTGNLCRSPMAERLGRAYVDERFGPAGVVLRTSSAGTRAVDGSAMHPFSALVLRGMGGDPEGFTARRLRPAHVEAADLVLTMTRAHRADVLSLSPRALGRTFTLREAAGLLELVEAPPAGASPRARVRALVRALAAARPRRTIGTDDDVPDPIGRLVEVHQHVGELIAGALLPVLDAVGAAALPDPDGALGGR